ncbi:HPr family phosphocarrier protein [Enterocloster lavalensis]|uniref:HPr family phosphocarrier protein n=1 Tax=Enterocloster lavalensis TaxID=460384 RepID=UPI002A801D59|nr:HPr family phosphocarrier protein [Enterocloster lavalensis]
MKRFQYTVKSLIGLHARPAGLLIQTARAYRSEITIQKGEKTANPKSLMSVLALNVNQNDKIVVTAEGEDEEEAIAGMEGFVRENL